MFKLSLHSINDDHLIIDITPDEHFKNNQHAIDHILTQIIKDHFKFLYIRKHKQDPFIKLLANSYTIEDLVYTVDNNLSKQLESFIDHLVPETSVITFYKDNDTYSYQYLGEKDKIIFFKQLRYGNDYEPVIKIPILK